MYFHDTNALGSYRQRHTGLGMNEQIASSDLHYAGTANLEVMSGAKRYNRFLVEQILKHAPSSGPIVDFGAGVGTFGAEIRQSGHVVCCVEPDPDHRAAIAKLGLAAFSSLEDIQGEVAYIYSLNVLEHIENDGMILANIAQKLASGGRLFLYVPAFPMLFGPMDKLVGHMRRYKRDELARKVTAAGLNVVRSEYVDSLGFAATLIFNVLGRSDGRLNTRAVRLYDRFVFPSSRAMDKLCSAILGKNVLLVAEKATRKPI